MPEPYCATCDHDDHVCKGCGVPIQHGEWACDDCKREAYLQEREAELFAIADDY